MSADIEVFTGPHCVHCEGAKKLLGDTGLAYRERRIDDPAELAELQSRLPRVRSIPQIFVDGVHIGNDDDLRVWHAEQRSPFEG